jgi:hypothetical protein
MFSKRNGFESESDPFAEIDSAELNLGQSIDRFWDARIGAIEEGEL